MTAIPILYYSLNIHQRHIAPPPKRGFKQPAGVLKVLKQQGIELIKMKPMNSLDDTPETIT